MPKKKRAKQQDRTVQDDSSRARPKNRHAGLAHPKHPRKKQLDCAGLTKKRTVLHKAEKITGLQKEQQQQHKPAGRQEDNPFFVKQTAATLLQRMEKRQTNKQTTAAKGQQQNQLRVCSVFKAGKVERETQNPLKGALLEMEIFFHICSVLTSAENFCEPKANLQLQLQLISCADVTLLTRWKAGLNAYVR